MREPRRAWEAGRRWLCTALVAALGVPCAAKADPPTDVPADAVAVAPGVYRVAGLPREVLPANLGRVGNAGFVVGESGVIAIDTGTSYRHGVALLAAIRRVTDKPVRLALITHARQEFLFGATAFREQGIPVRMHHEAAGLMASRCERCLATLGQLLGADAMRGTAMFTPDQTFDHPHAIDLIGRRLEVLTFGPSAAPGGIVVLDVHSGVLFAGGLLDAHRIPDVQDADLDGWLNALRALRGLPITTIVPGHGSAAPAAPMIDAIERYLTRLRTRVLELLRCGVALSDVPDAAALPEFASWDQAATIHRRNASVLFVRYERELMLSPADALASAR